jgi:hypothetical protein
MNGNNPLTAQVFPSFGIGVNRFRQSVLMAVIE